MPRFERREGVTAALGILATLRQLLESEGRTDLVRLADAMDTLLGGGLERPLRVAKTRVAKPREPDNPNANGVAKAPLSGTSNTPLSTHVSDVAGGPSASPDLSSGATSQEKQSDSEAIPESSSSLTLLSPAQPNGTANRRARVAKTGANGTAKRGARAGASDGMIGAVWRAYSYDYQRRYRGVQPTWNAKVGGQLKYFLTLVPHEDACGIASFFVQSNNQFYVNKGHDIGLLVTDATKLRTEYLAGAQMTATRARKIDQSQERHDGYEASRARLAAEDAAEGKALDG